MSIRAIHHVCIQTENYKESLDFYNKILGFEIIKESKNFHKRLEEYPSLVEGTGLENREAAQATQGFESLILRHYISRDGAAR